MLAWIPGRGVLTVGPYGVVPEMGPFDSVGRKSWSGKGQAGVLRAIPERQGTLTVLTVS